MNKEEHGVGDSPSIKINKFDRKGEDAKMIYEASMNGGTRKMITTKLEFILSAIEGLQETYVTVWTDNGEVSHKLTIIQEYVK